MASVSKLEYTLYASLVLVEVGARRFLAVEWTVICTCGVFLLKPFNTIGIVTLFSAI